MKYLSYVNTKQGSASRHRFSNGNTLPLVQLPFGMAAFCPQTCNNYRWYYHPQDRSLEGIRLTHQPSPWIADYGAVCFMTQKEPLKLDGDERWSGFRPQDAVLTPFYLNYRLIRTRSNFELTPTERGAKLRISFDKEGENYFSAHSVKDNYSFEYCKDKNTLYITTNNTSGGDAVDFCEYVVVKFPENSVDAEGIKIQNDDDAFCGKKISGEDTAIHIKLKEKVTEISLATSYISFQQAEITLAAE
ncbi:MAG: hypothetical protein MJ120_06430, partial [Clostridia bacterium]|nr:hypothetical protein [Clostridia bacterium]